MKLVPGEVECRFSYHAPCDAEMAGAKQIERYKTIRDQGKSLAETILRLTPESREQSLAITKLEEVVMWANAGIARREEGL